MITYIIRRLIQAVIVIIAVSLIVFLLMRAMPGDPVLLFVAENELKQLTEADYQAIRAEFGLDKSLPIQYFDWASGIIRGDFGESIIYNTSVGSLLLERLPVTVHLSILAVILASVLGILGGLICALRRGGALDALVISMANFGISIPIFWLGILMIYLFGLYLGVLPIQGYTSPFEDFWLSTRQLIMPVFCMAVVSMASKARLTRSSILEVVRQDYIRTAWSKGLSERAIVIRHILKNGLIPVITIIGMQVSHIFGGSVLVETVFSIPGMGRLMVNSVFANDYPIVQGCTLIFAFIVVIVNLIVDISYGWLDPRIRYG